MTYRCRRRKENDMRLIYADALKKAISETTCESCIHYPPSALDGNPCCFCDPIDPLLNCYQRKDDDIDA